MLLQLITDGFLLYQEPLLALDLNVSSDFLSKKQCKLTTMDGQHMNIIDLKKWGDYSITWRIGLPILQFFPVYPGTQLQLKSFTASVQLPPLSHGPSAQSSISWRKFKTWKIYTFWNKSRNSCNAKFYYQSMKDFSAVALFALSGCIDFFRIAHIITFGSASIMIFKLLL